MGRATITKEQIAELDTVTFPGKIHVVDTTSKARDALAYLNKLKMVGFDTETRPSFHRGASYKVALIQISSADECFLFRVNKLGMTDALKAFLENEKITKIGLSLKDDFGMIHRVSDTQPHGFIELQTLAPKFGISDASLQKIYAIIFGEKISKSQRLTNWEADELTPAQQVYAAIDAWACLEIYTRLTTAGFDPAKSKYYVDDAPQDETDKA